MDKQYQKIRKQACLLKAICGSLLIGLPAIAPETPSAYAMPPMKAEKPVSGTNPNPTILNQAPDNGGTSTSPANARPSIFNEPPYNRLPGTSPNVPSTSPTTRPTPGSVIQPPLPEEQQAPSGMVMPVDGKINIKLVNATNAAVTYQVIGDTEPRTLVGDSDVTLQNLETPVTVTFEREDKGFLKVSPQASSEGLLEVTLDEATNVDEGKGTMNVQEGGLVFLN